MSEITNNTPVEPTFDVLAPEPVQPPVKLRHAMTLANLWHVWIGLRSTAAPNTVLQYQGVAKEFCAFFGPDSGHRVRYKLDKEGMLAWMQNLQTRSGKFNGHL